MTEVGDGGWTEGSKDPSTRLVAFALHPKKMRSFVTPRLKEELERAGFSLRELDPSLSLEEQGPFDVLLHKMTSRSDWPQRLEEYARAHPETCIIDHPDDIAVLANRMTMLRPASEARLNTPSQFLLENRDCEVHTALKQRGMKLPVVAKPLRAGGSSGSHTLGIIYDERGVQELLDGKLEPLKPPVVLQQFHEHGGVLFKVYVLGDTVQAVHRPSIRDARFGEENHDMSKLGVECRNGDRNEIGAKGNAMPCHEIQKDAPHVEMWTYLSRTVPNKQQSEPCVVSMPPQYLLREIAKKLRQVLHLELFNFDLIRCKQHAVGNSEQDVYYIIDINYFPGYSKMPGFEIAFASFLRSYLNSGHEKLRKE